ncbi:cytochrome P450 [Sciscionella sediminilitoris]|uniref:cytochrome P450 n=1 Tax=Sciscionella sediminilitoris TaxID=1445613 RepID=UPI0004DEE73A|nr:cytochrome P450 [Sciscionella sp. SE31]
MSVSTFPVQRETFFDPPRELLTFPPVQAVHLADGTRSWVVTGHAEVRAVLADPRFSSDRTGAVTADNPERALRLRELRERRGESTPPGSFLGMDPPEHGHYRKLLTSQFTLRRMRALETRIAEIVSDQLDELAGSGQPADLVAHFAMPVPSLVICELLGVPYARRAEFQHATKTLLRRDTDVDEMERTTGAVREFLHELVRDKRGAPTDDILGGLIAQSGLSDQELVNISFLLLAAGHETTANMLGLGTFALLCHPEQLRILRADPGLMPTAVEELLRYLTIISSLVPRVATEDLSIGDTLIRAGETVGLSLAAANRDSALTENPGELDVSRARTHHLAFGHGIHQCLGQQLARSEMTVGFRALLDRFATLRLAVAPEEVPLRSDMTIYGVHELPVAW